MNTTIILLIIVLAIAGINYLLIKANKKLKIDYEYEKFRADQYFHAMQDNKELQKKAAIIDKDIEEKKNERKKLSKADKIKLANNRNSDN